MGFSSGAMSFRRYVVIGKQPALDQDLLDAIDAMALRPGEVGVPDEVEYGWSGGRHVLDGNFSFANNVFNDALHFALRIDTNKVPGDLKKAYQMIEEEAAASGNPSGHISKLQKREAKDSARRKVDDEMRSGKFRRSKLVPLVWDHVNGVVYSNAAMKQQEMLLELFERTFGLKLLPTSAGATALRLLESRGKRRDYEDFRPTKFARGPEGDGQLPEYPWTAKGPEPKDFLGNEFLLWLWYTSEAGGAMRIASEEISLIIDRTLALDCSFGVSGKTMLTGSGPGKMIEAADALRSGKVPRRAGLLIDANGMAFSTGIVAETLAFSSLKLPEIEDAESPRVLFEERLNILRGFLKTWDATFDHFLTLRASEKWESVVSSIRKWVKQSVVTVAAA